MEEELLICSQCGVEFVFPREAQAKYLQKNFSPPKRCPECRHKKNRPDENHSGRIHADKKKHYRQKYRDLD